MTPNEIIQSFDELYPGIREKYDGGLYQKKDIYLMMFPQLPYFVALDPNIGWYTCHKQYAVGVQTVEQLTKTLGKTVAERQLTQVAKQHTQRYLENLVDLTGEGAAELIEWDKEIMAALGLGQQDYYQELLEIKTKPQLQASSASTNLTAVR